LHAVSQPVVFIITSGLHQTKQANVLAINGLNCNSKFVSFSAFRERKLKKLRSNFTSNNITTLCQYFVHIVALISPTNTKKHQPQKNATVYLFVPIIRNTPVQNERVRTTIYLSKRQYPSSNSTFIDNYWKVN
jgi:hypothetical protein